MDTKAAFEKWAEEVGALPWGYLKKQRTESGNYSVQIYTYMWKAWQAKPICSDELACDMAKEIMDLLKETNLGGDIQLQAKIQCLLANAIATSHGIRIKGKTE